jgi:hypothetical protein
LFLQENPKLGKVLGPATLRFASRSFFVAGRQAQHRRARQLRLICGTGVALDLLKRSVTGDRGDNPDSLQGALGLIRSSWLGIFLNRYKPETPRRKYLML